MTFASSSASFLPKERQSLRQIKEASTRCGDPHARMNAPLIHVAGSNGKGSTIAMMRAILQEQGLRVHVLTSPHLVSFRERIIIAGEPIALWLWEECNATYQRLIPEDHLTYFEHMTLIALMAFTRVDADCVLVETGLGGRLDATNIVHPTATVITPISLDHQEVLGESLAKITKEKAGIFKPSVPVIVGRQEPHVVRDLKKYARALGCPFMLYGEDFKHEKGKFLWRCLSKKSPSRIFSLPHINLKGEHQRENASTALATLLQMEPVLGRLQENSVTRGLAHVQWQGRFQRLPQRSYLGDCSGCYPVILDVGHNPQAFSILKDLLKKDAIKQAHVVVGLKKTKSITLLLDALQHVISSFVAVPIEEDGHDSSTIIQEARKRNLNAYEAQSFPHALSIIKTLQNTTHFSSHPNKENALLVMGSHQVVGSALGLEEKADSLRDF